MLLQIDMVRLGFSIVAAMAGFLILLELGSRWFFGLGNPLIYQADEAMGYILAPDQRSRRASNRIEINEYSMRSRSISRERPAHTLRILLLGDSIVNGAWWTDQDRTISSLLEKQLQPHHHQIEVLNASANSWGPRNQLAYLQRYGTFDAQIVILLMNTDDLASGIPNSQIVGNDWNYPDRKPLLALEELYQRYLRKKSFVNDLPDPGDRIAINLEAVGQIQTIVEDKNSLFLLAITPLIREVENKSKPFDLKSRERLTSFVETQNIPFLDFLPLFMTDSAPETLYRDNIHITSKGNEIVSTRLGKLVQENYR